MQYYTKHYEQLEIASPQITFDAESMRRSVSVSDDLPRKSASADTLIESSEYFYHYLSKKDARRISKEKRIRPNSRVEKFDQEQFGDGVYFTTLAPTNEKS